MKLPKPFSTALYLMKKGALVVRREGLVNGLKRGYQVYREVVNIRKSSATNTTLLDIRGVRYTKKGKTIRLHIKPDPQVSLIIPVFNGFDYVKDCLDSLFASPVNFDYEVIVIDQHSDDGVLDVMRDFARRYDNFKLVENDANVGFARALNQGAALAKGKYLVLANSDLIFTPGWLDPLVEKAQSDSAVAVVSPMTNYVGEGPQIDVNAATLKPSEAAAYAAKVAKRSVEFDIIDRLVFFCVLVKKNIYDLLGGLSGVYSLGNYEDDDFCLRARLTGYTLKIASNSFVYHLGSKTFKRQKIDYVDIMTRNEKIFYQRVVDFALASPLQPGTIDLREQASVIMRTKNRPQFLSQALSCLANQTYRQFEVILVDQGDIDLRPILAPFQPHLRIQHISNESGKGRGAGLNAGLKSAGGQWIAYLDDDDLIYPTHLENIASAWAAHPEASLVFTDANKSLCWVDDHQGHIVPIARERFVQKNFTYEDLLFDNYIPIISYSHRREDGLRLGGYDEQLEIFEDWDFLLRLTKDAHVVRIPKLTCEYRIRFTSKPNDTTLMDRHKAQECRRIIYQRYPAPNARVLELRKATEDVVKLQIQTVQQINDQNLSDLQKSYLIAASLGAFRSVNQSVQLI